MMGTNYFSRSWSTLRLGLLFLLLPQLAFSTVYVPSYNISYSSMPALFGGTWSEDVTVEAYLQLVAEEPLLCESPQDDNVKNAITVPNDDPDNYDNPIPVALLVQRGECTFMQKAQVALQWAPTVQYVIVYDNEITNLLVPMSSEESLANVEEKNLSLLFVSYHSGMGKSCLVVGKKRSTTVQPSGIMNTHTYSYAIHVSCFQN
jgi:hypothetical protein